MIDLGVACAGSVLVIVSVVVGFLIGIGSK